MYKGWACALLLAGCAFLLAVPVLAEEPWVAEMPTADEVVAATQGSDAFDTAARQWVAYNNLFNTTMELIGDRYVTNASTPAERQLLNGYNDGRSIAQSNLKASLPPEERDFYIGTRFALWNELRGRYLDDRAFNNQVLNALFSAQFRQTYAPALQKWWLSNTGGMGLIPGPRPANSAVAVGVMGAAILIGFIFPILLKRGRMKLDRKDVYKLYLGGGTYRLNAATGTVQNVSKMATTQVYGGGGGGSFNEYGGSVAPVTISSSTTVHDQFFIRRADGSTESVQLAGWDFPVADGHVASAVWVVPEGSRGGPFVILRNHTTRDIEFKSRYLVDHLIRGSGALIWLLEIGVGVLIGVAAATATPLVSLPVGIGTALVSIFVGSVVWHRMIKPRFLSRFKRVDLPRLYTELDRAASMAPAPAG